MFSEVLKASDRRLTAEGIVWLGHDRQDSDRPPRPQQDLRTERSPCLYTDSVVLVSSCYLPFRGCFSVFRCMRSAVLHWFDFPALLFCSAWLNQNDSVSEPRENLSLSFLLSLTLTLYTVRDKLTVAPFLMSCFLREPCHTHFSMYKPRSCSFPTVHSLPLNLTFSVQRWFCRDYLPPSIPPYRHWGSFETKRLLANWLFFSLVLLCCLVIQVISILKECCETENFHKPTFSESFFSFCIKAPAWSSNACFRCLLSTLLAFFLPSDAFCSFHVEVKALVTLLSSTQPWRKSCERLNTALFYI